MSIFRNLQRKAANLRAKKQSEYYKKLQRDTRLANLQKAKLERLKAAKQAKLRAQSELHALRPKRQGFHMPKLVGDLNALTKGMPSDADLNRAVYGATSPKRPPSKLDTGPSMSDLDQLSKDIFK